MKRAGIFTIFTVLALLISARADEDTLQGFTRRVPPASASGKRSFAIFPVRTTSANTCGG